MSLFLSDSLHERALARVGTTLKGKWRLESVLGAGGMATVYAASHRTGHAVAVKVLHTELAVFKDACIRFAQEPYVANRVHHKGVVRVIDDDVDDEGIPFVVMELLDGVSVDDLCRRRGGQLPVDEALEITDQLLDVLAAAHAAQILHRDVKPQNVFVTSDWTVKLLDFGVAHAEGPVTVTRTGGVVGTPAFMPPEQARGHLERMDERSDIWAVGATLFTMLSGTYVHEAGTAAEFLAAAMTPARSIADVMPELPTAVVDLVTRSLAYERDDRWPSARAMAVATRAVKGVLPAGKKRSRGKLSLPNEESDSEDTLPRRGPGGTLLLRDSIPDWFAPRLGTILFPPQDTHELDASKRPSKSPDMADEREKDEKPPREEEAMPDRWYVSNGVVEVGPVPKELVCRGVEAGKVPEGCLVRNELWDTWLPLTEVLPDVCRNVTDGATEVAPERQPASPEPVMDDEVTKPRDTRRLRGRSTLPALPTKASTALRSEPATDDAVIQTAAGPSRHRRFGFGHVIAVVAAGALVATVMSAWFRRPSFTAGDMSAGSTHVVLGQPALMPTSDKPAGSASIASVVAPEATTGSMTGSVVAPPKPLGTALDAQRGMNDSLSVTAPTGIAQVGRPDLQNRQASHSHLGHDADVATTAIPVVPQPLGLPNEEQLRLDIELKIAKGKASRDDIRMLKALCSKSGDRPCRERAAEMLRRTEPPTTADPAPPKPPPVKAPAPDGSNAPPKPPPLKKPDPDDPFGF